MVFVLQLVFEDLKAALEEARTVRTLFTFPWSLRFDIFIHCNFLSKFHDFHLVHEGHD
jgi:hypothetical protein